MAVSVNKNNAMSGSSMACATHQAVVAKHSTPGQPVTLPVVLASTYARSLVILNSQALLASVLSMFAFISWIHAK